MERTGANGKIKFVYIRDRSLFSLPNQRTVGYSIFTSKSLQSTLVIFEVMLRKLTNKQPCHRHLLRDCLE